MKLALFFDTETSGLPLFSEPSEDPRQPHIVQLAAALVNLDTREVLEELNVIIKPDGWEIPDEVAVIHGITTERALAEGIPEIEALDRFLALNARAEVRIAIDADASWRAPGLGHIGVHRSAVQAPGEVAALGRAIAARPGFRLVGLMMYEAQIAGQGDATGSGDTVIRWMQRRSSAELLERRAEIVAGLRDIAPLEFVNGGGTGSLEFTASDQAVTELTAGSGLLAGHLFDGYRAFDLAPAAAFALEVVRKPAADIATVLGGGWIASAAR